MSALVADALAYAARGWSILPTVGKKPAVRAWKRYQTEPASARTLRRWFAKPDVTGLAVICGPVSGALVVRDFDSVDSFNRWKDAYPELAETLPTVQTARGFHVYFTGDVDRIVSIDIYGAHEGELRGAGYVLIPPAQHPSGAIYKWTIPLPDGPIPAVDAVLAGLLPAETDKLESAARSKSVMQQSRRSIQRKTEQTEDIEGVRGGGGEGGSGLSEQRLEEIIRATQPHGPGERNRAVFELARELQGEEILCDADPRELRSIVERWHKLALPVIRTLAFEESWFDFLKAWQKVRHPKGKGPMDVIFAQAKAANPPEWAARYDQPKMRQLVTLCRELQRHAGDGAFFLGCRTAGKLLDVDHSTASRWLDGLKMEGVLQELEKGGKGRGRYRATRYRYVADEQPVATCEQAT